MLQLDRPLGDGVVTVRPFDPSDRPVLLRGRDADYHRFLGDGSPEPAPVGCIHVDRAIVGWIDFDNHRHWLDQHEVNIGYNVFPEHRGRGHGTRALRLLCQFLAVQSPPLRPTLLIDPDNIASLAVAVRAGFEHVDDVEGERLFRPTPSGEPGSGPTRPEVGSVGQD